MDEKLKIAVADIVCRRRLCEICRNMFDVALREAHKAFLEKCANYDGMLCGEAQWMKFRAMEALEDAGKE